MSTFTVLMVTAKVTTSWGPRVREGFLWGKLLLGSDTVT